MLTGFSTAVTAIGADLATIGGGLVTLALVGLGIAFVVSKIKGR